MQDFDTVFDRRPTFSTKWTRYAPDVLPFWVADMDFQAPSFVREALQARVDHGIFGYTRTPATLVEAFQSWLTHHYQWTVPEEWLVWIAGVVPGVNLGARAARGAKDGVLVPTPVYYPFLEVAGNLGSRHIESRLVRDGSRWVMDFDDLAKGAKRADSLLLSNPQNPTGRAYSAQELAALARVCEAEDVVVVSDEIHSPLVLTDGAVHIPIARAHPELKTISLFAPTKAYNIPGLSSAVAVIPDPALRSRFLDARAGLVSDAGPLAHAACEAAYRDRSEWLQTLNQYLRANRDALAEVAGARMTEVEATYLAWIDVSDLPVSDIEAHFVAHGLGLSNGAQFGGPGFVRFNFGCPRDTLNEGLKRLASALK